MNNREKGNKESGGRNGSSDQRKDSRKNDRGSADNRNQRYRGNNNNREHSKYTFKGADPTLIVLRWGRDNNFPEFRRVMSQRLLRDYSYSAMFMRDSAYYEPKFPEIDDVRYDNDRVYKTRIDQEIKNATNLLAKIQADKPAIFAVIWGQLSIESRDKIRAHANWPLIELEDNPLELWLAIIATHIVAAVGDATVDRARARDDYARLRQGQTEYLSRFKERFDNALLALDAVEESVPENEVQAFDFINRLDDSRYAQLKAKLQNNVQMGIGVYRSLQ